MNIIPRTRLNPGSAWIRCAADATASEQPPPMPRRAPFEPPTSTSSPPAPMPGVDVSELDSQTLFDRLFGNTPAGSTPAGGLPRR